MKEIQFDKRNINELWADMPEDSKRKVKAYLVERDIPFETLARWMNGKIKRPRLISCLTLCDALRTVGYNTTPSVLFPNAY